MNVLVINCGSSSLKFQLINSETEAVAAKGLCERIGLDGKPNEIKLKYLADNDLASLSGDAAIEAMKDMIKHKESDLTNNMKSQGTTPRRITDLLASLSDLTSGSGDKGTPFILIQNYFKNYSM